MSIWAGSNLWVTRRDGTQLDKGSTFSYSKEPTGLGYNPADGTLFISDDDADKIFQVKAGSDGRFGTGDDSIVSFSTRTWNDGDPEDVDYNNVTDKLYVLDGVGTEVWVLTKGSNGKFDGPSPAGDDGLTHFDMGGFGATDIEGIGHNSTTGNLLLADRGTKKVFEVTPTGSLLQTITLGGTAVKKPSDITPAPASSGSGALSLYVSDRAVDNDNTPNENDGMVHELTYPGSGGVTNTRPTVNAGPRSRGHPAERGHVERLGHRRRAAESPRSDHEIMDEDLGSGHRELHRAGPGRRRTPRSPRRGPTCFA